MIRLSALRSLLGVFGLAFLLNFAWEHLHALLYVHYRGGPITERVLLHATLVDAVIIAGVGLFMLSIPVVRRNGVIALLFLLVGAILIELWALDTGRWAYTEAMPVIPILSTGLTPTIQLALTGYLAFWLSVPSFSLLQRFRI